MPECGWSGRIMCSHTHTEALAFDKKAIKPQEATNFMVVGPKLVLIYEWCGPLNLGQKKLKSFSTKFIEEMPSHAPYQQRSCTVVEPQKKDFQFTTGKILQMNKRTALEWARSLCFYSNTTWFEHEIPVMLMKSTCITYTEALALAKKAIKPQEATKYVVASVVYQHQKEEAFWVHDSQNAEFS